MAEDMYLFSKLGGGTYHIKALPYTLSRANNPGMHHHNK